MQRQQASAQSEVAKSNFIVIFDDKFRFGTMAVMSSNQKKSLT
jgi:hypothetical protein